MAGYSGDYRMSLHIVISKIFILPVLIIVFEAVALVVTPLVLLFTLTR